MNRQESRTRQNNYLGQDYRIGTKRAKEKENTNFNKTIMLSSAAILHEMY